MSVALVAAVTLTAGDDTDMPFQHCIVCGEQGMGDVLANILLFVPLGASLTLAGVVRRRVVLTALALTAVVEFLQAFVIPGRDPSLGDIVANTLGAVLGLLVVSRSTALLSPAPSHERLLGPAATVAAVLVIGATAWFVHPVLPLRPLFGQWTARFENSAWYTGEVLDARIGNYLLPSRLLDWPVGVRRELLGGTPVEVAFRAGVAPDRRAPVFGIWDDHPSQLLLIGAEHRDLVLALRQRAHSFRLSEPVTRIREALSGIRQGDTVSLAARFTPDGTCLAINGAQRCGLGLTPGRGWALLASPVRGPRDVLLDAAWVGVLFIGVGLWNRGLRLLLAGSVGAVALLAIPAASWLVPAAPLEWVGAAAGLVVGMAVRRAAARRPETPQ